jgi:hypothetical protein
VHKLRFQHIGASFVEDAALIKGVYFTIRLNIKFCLKLGKIASGTCAMLSEAYGGEAMKESRLFE